MLLLFYIFVACVQKPVFHGFVACCTKTCIPCTKTCICGMFAFFNVFLRVFQRVFCVFLRVFACFLHTAQTCHSRKKKLYTVDNFFLTPNVIISRVKDNKIKHLARKKYIFVEKKPLSC